MSAFKKLSLLLACLAASYTADALECDKGYQLLWPLRLNGNQAVELEGVANSGSRIFESAGDEDLVVPLCAKVEEKSRSFTYRHYSGNRLQQGSFADVTLQCVAGLGRPSEPKGKEYPPYIGYERDDRYILCDKLNRAAFLKLDEHYVLEQNNGGKTTLPRVGPFGLDTAAEPDPNGYIWPANITADNYFTVYEYPKGEGWADLYPISKRLCQIDKAGDISLTDIPTITISKDDVKLTAGDNLPEGTKSRCADKADLGPAICPPGTDTTISLTVAGNGRVRPFRKDAQIKPADTWGKDLTVALKAPCGKPLEILIDMIDKNAKMPGLGVNDKWDESIKVARRVKCTYTGFNPLKNGNVHFGKGSAELNHNLGKAEWWTCDEPMSLDDANSSSS